MRRELLLLDEMVVAAARIIELVGERSADDLEADNDRRDAVLWNYTVLGEAAAQLPADFVEQHDAIPWQRPAQLRNRIVHGYWSIDVSVLVKTARDQLPEFTTRLRSVRAELDQ
jgi:uncharacterized protein with HEPN domain